MAQANMKKRHGLVVILDALGASEFDERKIKQFLSARKEINAFVVEFVAKMPGPSKLKTPSMYTFGDTIVIAFEVPKSLPPKLLVGIGIVLRRYLFHSMEQGILFRGAFSIGTFIADGASNTVMGEAVSDAAAWYERADWFGLASTPRAKTIIESIDAGTDLRILNPNFMELYPVPIKGGGSIELFCISWAGAFFDKKFLGASGKKSARHWFLEVMSGFSVPLGTERKYENTKQFFAHIEKTLAAGAS